MVMHNKHRKDKQQKAVDKNGLTSSLDLSDSLNLAEMTDEGYQQQHHQDNNNNNIRTSSKASHHSQKSNHRVHFKQQQQQQQQHKQQQQYQQKQQQHDRLADVSNSRVQRFRGGYPKRKRSAKLLLLRRKQDIGFGFSIRGGVEHGTGIFVSNINKYSDAYNQGLQVGDQILRANNELFEGILHDEAAQYIQRQPILRLIVLSLGVVPGNKIALTEYQWMDCYGRPCSPLMSHAEERRQLSDGINPSRRLLEDEDERKVNVVVGNSATLGLLIRGGSEYGLGIFVAGIDQDSVADRSGIMVGEQILEINSIDFVNITHADAAEIIRSSNMMTLTLKDVGKIPLARIVYDKTEWIQKKHMIQREARNKQKQKDLILQQGLRGGILSHQSLASPVSFQWVEETAQNKLNTDDWATLKYYIREYVRDNLSASELALSLLDLFDTDEKLTLLEEVRGIVRPQDIEMFDELMLSMEVAVMKNRSSTSSSERTRSVKADISPRLSSYDRDADNDDEVLQQEPIIQHTQANELESFAIDYDATNDMHDFNYRTLHEESYQSIIDNMTEDTDLSHSLTSAGPLSRSPNKRSIIDESFDKLETVLEDDDEPLYARVDRNHTLTEYNERSPPIELKTFQSPLLERHIYESPPARRKQLKSPPPPNLRRDQLNSPPRPILQEEEAEKGDLNNSNDEEDYGSNQLGFAFSFLNSEENSPQTPKRDSSGGRPELEIHSPTRVVKGNRIYRDLHNDINDDANEFAEEDDVTDGEPYHRISNIKNNFQNFQPKSLNMTSQAPIPSLGHVMHYTEEIEPRKTEDGDKQSVNGKIKIIAGHEYSPKQINHGDANRRTPDESPKFDVTKTLDGHYSNFSVNDIIRQNFLPTTRVHSEASGNENNEVQNLLTTMQLNQEQNNDELVRKTSLTRLNMLNIQNQYQYQESKNTDDEQNETPALLRPSSAAEESKAYGKPIISPRPTMMETPQSLPPPPQSFLNDTTDENITTNRSTTSYTPKTRITRVKSKGGNDKPDIRWFSIDRLKKTQHGSVLLGRDEQRDAHEKHDIDEEADYYNPSELLGKMSLSIEKLNSPPESERANQTSSKKARESSPRYISPRNASFSTTDELNIVRSSHPQVESNVSTLRKRIDESINSNTMESPRVESKTNDHATKRINDSLNNNNTKSPRVESKVNDQAAMQAWVKKTDFRPKITNTKYKTNGSVSESNGLAAKTTSMRLQSKIDVFSQPKEDPMAAFQTYRKQKKGEGILSGPRTVKIANSRSDPGFVVDVRTNQNGENEIYVASITNQSIDAIQIGDVILGAGDHTFKPGIKTGLANLIIRNKFSSTEDDHVTLLLK